MNRARYALGRTLQLVGMLILPIGIATELHGKVTLGVSMMIALGGLAIFYWGRAIQVGA